MFSPKDFAFNIMESLKNVRKDQVDVSTNFSITFVTFVIPTTLEK